MQGQLGHTIHFQKICIAFRKNLRTGLSENFLIFNLSYYINIGKAVKMPV